MAIPPISLRYVIYRSSIETPTQHRRRKKFELFFLSKKLSNFFLPGEDITPVVTTIMLLGVKKKQQFFFMPNASIGRYFIWEQLDVCVPFRSPSPLTRKTGGSNAVLT